MRWVLLGGGAIGLAVLVVVAIVAVPIITHVDQGTSTQAPVDDPWPTTVTASGGDGRERVLSVAGEDGAAVDTSALVVGERLVVTGAGYDAAQGIYVAICVIPDSPTVKPGPCIGGVPAQAQTEVVEGAVQWAPSNWINDDWAWKLFGARSYDDTELGTFTAYVVVGDPVGEGFDCRVQACGIVTRNDHTALADRVQDVKIPVGFAD